MSASLTGDAAGSGGGGSASESMSGSSGTAAVGGASAGTAGSGDPGGSASAGEGGEPATCSDGVLNGDETALDCGGRCQACPVPCSQLVAGPDPSTIAGSDALVGWYRFADASKLGADSSNGHHDALTLTKVTQVSDSDRGCAGVFTGSSALSLPVSVTKDMTLALWIRTDTPGAGGLGDQWYAGCSLIDGEQVGRTDDFGLTLLASQAAFGVGNPDATIHDDTNLVDDHWHHVLATRVNDTGAVTLYVDGKLGPSASFPPGPRLGSSAIQVGARRLIGELADIRLYQRVLTPNEIAAVATGQ